MQSENGGVVGMLEVTCSDISRLKTETAASEAKAVEEFRSPRPLQTTKADLQGTQKERGASLDYFDECALPIAGKCAQ